MPANYLKWLKRNEISFICHCNMNTLWYLHITLHTQSMMLMLSFVQPELCDFSRFLNVMHVNSLFNRYLFILLLLSHSFSPEKHVYAYANQITQMFCVLCTDLISSAFKRIYFRVGSQSISDEKNGFALFCVAFFFCSS